MNYKLSYCQQFHFLYHFTIVTLYYTNFYTVCVTTVYICVCVFASQHSL